MVKKEAEEQAMEPQIRKALNSRIQHLKDNAESFTFESVRRILEKDLGLERFALDVHKRLIKQLLEQVYRFLNSNTKLYEVLIKALAIEDQLMEGPDNDGASRTSLKNTEEDVPSSETEAAEFPEKNEIKRDPMEPAFEDGMKTEDSPIMGLMTAEVGSVDAQSTEITESKIKKAIWDRASHIKDNSETMTPAGVRRLLEEDLGLPASTLDPFKKFIRAQIDEVLESSEVNDSANGLKKKNSGNNQVNIPEKISPSSSGSLESENEEVNEKAKSRKRAAGSRENIDKYVGMKKHKGPQKEVNLSSKKQNKLAKKPSDVDAEEGDDGSESDDLHTKSSSEKTSKKKQLSTPGYGKRVENLKSIIKACGMSVAPSVYKKAKQVPDEKREAFLIKELEQILSREGLSSNPTEKEIKEVRKRKERAKELEGIDLSNIVSSSRRRTMTTYMAPPKPKVAPPKPKERAEQPVDDTTSTKKNENDEGEDDGDDGFDKQAPEKKEEELEKEKEEKEAVEEEEEEEDDEDDDDDNDDGSQSEEFSEDDEDSD